MKNPKEKRLEGWTWSKSELNLMVKEAVNLIMFERKPSDRRYKKVEIIIREVADGK